MRRGRLAPLGAVLVLVVACAPHTREHRPGMDIDLPQAWRADAAALDAEPAPWLSDFDDSTLAALVDEALVHNHELSAAAARWARARAAAEAAGALRWPQLDAGASAARSRSNVTDFRGDSVKRHGTTYTLEASLSWEVDLWGRLAAQNRAAGRRARAARADLRSARLSLIAAVARGYIAVVHDRLQVDIAQDYADNIATTAELVRARYRDGEVRAADVTLIAAEVEQARADLARWRGTLASSMRALEILLGRYPAGLVETPRQLPQIQTPIAAGLPVQLLLRRPDLRAAAERLLAANADTSGAHADLFPRLSLTAAGGRRSDDLGDLLDPANAVWNLIGNLTAPLLDGGRRRAVVRQRQADADAALQQFRQSALQAFKEVEEALALRSLLRERRDALLASLAQLERAVQLLREQYDDGQTDVLDLLRTARNVLGARSGAAAMQRAVVDNRIALHLALGGPALPPPRTKKETP
ncbi:MAG: efflux transporter outer membrane subunit [Planctomycetota bacterium]